MRYEKRHEPIASRQVLLRRLGRSFSVAAAIILSSLIIGMLGYHYLGELNWVDSILEAAMILGGMGPVATMHNDTVKIFASFYALFSGFILLSSFGIFTAPMLHRMLHYFHAEQK